MWIEAGMRNTGNLEHRRLELSMDSSKRRPRCDFFARLGYWRTAEPLAIPLHPAKISQATPSLASMDWNASTGGVIFLSAIAPDGTIYVGSNDNKLHAFHSHGSSKWTSSTGNCGLNPFDRIRRHVYLGSWDNKIYALNPSDGSVLWNMRPTVMSQPVRPWC